MSTSSKNQKKEKKPNNWNKWDKWIEIPWHMPGDKEAEEEE